MTTNLQKRLLLVVIILLLSCTSVFSQETQVYKFKSVQGVTSFSDIEPLDADFEVIKVACYACELNTHIDWYHVKLYLSQYQQAIDNAAQRHSVDVAFIRAIIHAESHFEVNARSKQGAQGLMQLMPDTAKALGVNNVFIAQQNIEGGVKHLSNLLKKYQGDKRLVTAAYNAGEGAIKKYAGIPPFPETQVYVERVAILHQRYKTAASL